MPAMSVRFSAQSSSTFSQFFIFQADRISRFSSIFALLVTATAGRNSNDALDLHKKNFLLFLFCQRTQIAHFHTKFLSTTFGGEMFLSQLRRQSARNMRTAFVESRDGSLNQLYSKSSPIYIEQQKKNTCTIHDIKAINEIHADRQQQQQPILFFSGQNS